MNLSSQGFKALTANLFSNSILSEDRYREILSSGLWDLNTATKLLMEIQSSAVTDPLVFHIFVTLLDDCNLAQARQRDKLITAYQKESNMKLTSNCCEQGKICLCLHSYNSEWDPDHYDVQLLMLNSSDEISSNVVGKDTVIFFIEYDTALNIRKIDSPRQHGSLELKIDSSRECKVQFSINSFKVITRKNDRDDNIFFEHISMQCTCNVPPHCITPNNLHVHVYTKRYLEYEDELSPNNLNCQQQSQTYRRYIMDCDIENSNRETHRIKHNPEHSKSFIAYFIGYHSIVLTHSGLYEDAFLWLKEALELTGSSNLHNNCLLVRGRTYRLMCKALRSSGEYEKAQECLLQSI